MNLPITILKIVSEHIYSQKQASEPNDFIVTFYLGKKKKDKLYVSQIIPELKNMSKFPT